MSAEPALLVLYSADRRCRCHGVPLCPDETDHAIVQPEACAKTSSGLPRTRDGRHAGCAGAILDGARRWDNRGLVASLRANQRRLQPARWGRRIRRFLWWLRRVRSAASYRRIWPAIWHLVQRFRPGQLARRGSRHLSAIVEPSIAGLPGITSAARTGSVVYEPPSFNGLG